jgi:hypothetical protein
MNKADVWLTRFRALLGAGILGWELPVEHAQQWWTLVLAAWLLGAPLEELIRFLTAGRLQINVKSEKDKDDDS